MPRLRGGLVCQLVLMGLAVAGANKGYDMEEIPTGAFKGYCVQLPYDQQNGLCQGYKGSPKVCSVSKDGEGNPLAAINWLEEEVFSRRAPHTDKSLERGGQSFEFLQIFLNNWVCKQLGENERVRTTLTDDEKQEAACKYIWRRDQEIQNGSLPNGAVPSEGDLWGTFTYKPPGQNLSNFKFKGIPLNQCEHDYDCREYNNPGDVHVCCDHCEEYFMKNCDIGPHRDKAFKFCMESAHCVCNSVTKKCARPNRERCPRGECAPGSPWDKIGGAYYPVHGAPCSVAPQGFKRAYSHTYALLAPAASLAVTLLVARTYP